jgi:hypothetical protein
LFATPEHEPSLEAHAVWQSFLTVRARAEHVQRPGMQPDDAGAIVAALRAEGCLGE